MSLVNQSNCQECYLDSFNNDNDPRGLKCEHKEHYKKQVVLITEMQNKDAGIELTIDCVHFKPYSYQ